MSAPHWLRELAGGHEAEADSLVGQGVAFLLCGRCSVADYLQLGPDERAALAMAGRLLLRARRSPEDEAAVWALLDGGEELTRMEEDRVFAALRDALAKRGQEG